MNTPVLERTDNEPGTIGYDSIDGVLVEKRVSIGSGKAAFRLGVALDRAAAAAAAGEVYPADVGYMIFPEPHRLKFPDLSFVRAERLSPSEIARTFFSIPPDIAVESVSPSDRAIDVEKKALAWIAAGTRLVWVLFPDSQTVHVYRHEGRDEILGSADVLRADAIVPGFELKVSEILPPPATDAAE